MRNLDPKVYEDAADLVERGYRSHCCSAILHALSIRDLSGFIYINTKDPYIKAFAKHFKPADKDMTQAWWDHPAFDSTYRDIRVKYLREMAEIVRKHKPWWRRIFL